jgi:spore coat protein U-like protein
MHRFLSVLIAVALLIGTSVDAGARQSASATLAVSANVVKNCTITTTPVAFGAYDPVTANATAPLDGTGSVVVTCTRGAAATVALNAGSNAQGTTRRMATGEAGATFLTYELYKDSGHAEIWGGETGNDLEIGAAPDRNPRTFVVYGRIAGGQDATVGTYSDVVVATVNF